MKDLGLEHLRAFLAVVDEGTQNKAADLLDIEQSAVARHVKRVTQHFGDAPLFKPGTSILTPRGKLVARAARAAVDTLRDTRDRLAGDQPVLRIGFIRVVRPVVEKALLSLTKAKGADFDVRLLELNSELQARVLTEGKLDIAISYAVPALENRSDLTRSVISEQPFALAVPKRAWVNGKLSLEALRSLHYVHPPRRLSPEVVEACDRWLEASKLKPARRIECALGTEVIAYAGAGYGYGFLPALWRTASSADVVFAPVPSFEPTARIALYSLLHVSERVKALRQSLSSAARAALRDF